LGHGATRGGPQGPRPPLLAVDREDLPRARVLPQRPAGARARRHGRLVPRSPRLVAAAARPGQVGMTRTRWLVTGAGGMLGHDLVDVLRVDGEVELTAVTRTQLDV